MAQSRVRDLETMQDKLLEETTDMRNTIEQQTERIAEQDALIENLQKDMDVKDARIAELEKQLLKTQKELHWMTD